MIRYLVTNRHAYTLGRYLQTWGQPLAGRFRVVPYERFLDAPEFEAHPGTYIFSDIERLTPLAAKLAARAWKTISDLGGDAREPSTYDPIGAHFAAYRFSLSCPANSATSPSRR